MAASFPCRGFWGVYLLLPKVRRNDDVICGTVHLGIQHPTTRNSQRPASAVRCHVPEPSATPPLSQRPASENGDGALPRGGTLRLYGPVRARVSEGDVMQISSKPPPAGKTLFPGNHHGWRAGSRQSPLSDLETPSY